MNKAYLISTVTALALGYAAGFATDDITAQAAVPQARDFNYIFEVTGTPKTALINWIQTNGCPKLDTELSLTGTSICDATKDATTVCFSKDMGANGVSIINANVRFSRSGTYTPADPQ